MPKCYKGAVQCPYYKQRSMFGVTCEGGEISLPDIETARDYKTHFCWNEVAWRHCSIAIIMQRYYDREEERGNYGKPSENT